MEKFSEKKLGKNTFDKQQPTDWIKKHKANDNRRTAADNYKNIDPIPADYPTFERTAYNTKKNEPEYNTKSFRYFGSA